MVLDYAIHTIDSCTVVLTLLLSIDRLYAIKNPMKIREFITNLHAKKTMTVSLTLVVLLKTSSFTFCELNTSILYCSFLSPTLFYTIPSIIILIINAILVKHMVNINVDVNDSIQMENLTENTNLRRNAVDIRSTFTSNNEMRKFSSRKKSLTQKSHYIVIFVMSLMSTFASIPYYTFNAYFSLFQLNLFKTFFRLETVLRIQMITSVFFNLNHCIHFFIYVTFYSEFRDILKTVRFRMFFK